MRRALVIAAIATPLVWLAWSIGIRALARDAGLDVPGPFEDLDDELVDPWGDV